MLTNISYTISLCCGIAIIILCLVSLSSDRFTLWPPLNTNSWQHYTFWILFRIYMLGLIIVSITDFGSAIIQASLWRYFIGIPLATFGFGLAIYLTNFLGWKNAYGEARGMKIDGAYQWSRNPIYIVSIIGMFGIGITVASWLVTTLLALWALFYLLAPFLEEPWLEKQYGDEYLAYRKRVPRFFKLHFDFDNTN